MEGKTDSIQRYTAELEEIARLDRRFYLNNAPSRSERASYALRQEHLNEIRNRFSSELGFIQDQRDVEVETFHLHIRDNASQTEIASAPQCRLAHDLNNSLGVVIGFCQLLSESVPNETTQRRLNGILEAARKMATRIPECSCQNRR